MFETVQTLHPYARNGEPIHRHQGGPVAEISPAGRRRTGFESRDSASEPQGTAFPVFPNGDFPCRPTITAFISRSLGLLPVATVKRAPIIPDPYCHSISHPTILRSGDPAAVPARPAARETQRRSSGGDSEVVRDTPESTWVRPGNRGVAHADRWPIVFRLFRINLCDSTTWATV